ncbi:AbrB/MazE/SpoVT family DNA-binding domain-containing protein [Nanoarchaeota archaeon]
MKRKVVQIGGFTKVISLPRQWVKKQKIEKGDELEIQERGDSLLIRCDDEKSKIASIDLRNTDRFLKRYIETYYRRGYDILYVKVPNEYFISLIQKGVSSRLLGFEIVEQKEHQVTIKSISDGIEQEFKVILRRIFLMLNTMAKEGHQPMKTGNYDKLLNLIELEEINNKFTNFCQRALNKQGHENHHNTNTLYNIVTQLEQIADAYAQIFKILNENPKRKLKPSTMKMYSMTESLLQKFHILFYNFKVERLLDFDKLQKEIIQKKDVWFGSSKNYVENYVCAQLFLVTKQLHHLTECLF